MDYEVKIKVMLIVMLSPNNIHSVTNIIYVFPLLAFPLIFPSERHFFSYCEWRSEVWEECLFKGREILNFTIPEVC
jgi:hypothetical protein